MIEQSIKLLDGSIHYEGFCHIDSQLKAIKEIKKYVSKVKSLFQKPEEAEDNKKYLCTFDKWYDLEYSFIVENQILTGKEIKDSKYVYYEIIDLEKLRELYKESKE